MNRYDAILLDADDTLMDFQLAEKHALSQVLARLNMDTEEATSAYHKANSACWRALERGELTQQRLRYKRFEDFFEIVGCKADPVEVGNWYIEALSHQGPLLPGALDVVKEIAKHRPIAIVTNGIAPIQHGRMDASGLNPYVKALVISDEMGVAKPNPKLIHEALKQLGGIKPTRALMVGDSLATDVTCARNAGVDACWLNAKGAKADPKLPIAYEITDISQLPAIALGVLP